MKKVVLIALIASAVLPITCCSSKTYPTPRYQVTWCNYDGTVLALEKYKKGDIPEYKNDTPVRDRNEQFSYTFSGWSPKISEVVEDITYTAQFESTVNAYTITWKNYDGSVLSVESYNYGDTPIYKGEAPKKEGNAQYAYTFTNWSPEIEKVTVNKTYTAQFERSIRQYIITWKNYDGSVIDVETYNYGETPSFKGDNPSRINLDDDDYYFRFVGWDSEIVAVTQNKEYTAQFEYDYGFEFEVYNNSYYKLKKCHLSHNKTIIVPSKYRSVPITCIEQGALQECSSVESLTLPFVGETISNNCFLGYVFGATSADENSSYVPETLKQLTVLDCSNLDKSRVFFECKSIEKFLLSGEIAGVGNETFKNCLSIQAFHIPSTCAYVSSSAFYNCPSLAEFTVDTNNEKLCSVDGVLFNKDKTILERFPSGKDASNYTIPTSVTRIYEYAFQGCLSLTSFIIPNSVTTINNGAFYGCVNIESVVLPISIIMTAVFDSTKLSSVTFSRQCTSITANAFKNYYSIKIVNLYDSVITINANAFSGCSPDINYYGSLTSWSKLSGKQYFFNSNVHLFFDGSEEECVNITVSSAKDYEFANSNNLKTITISEGVTSIGNSTFSNCTSLETIVIPNSVKSIGIEAFSNCTSLETIVIPNSVKTIESYAFFNCTSLSSISLSNSLETICNSAFYNCTSLKTIDIPDSVKTIESYAFTNCTSLESFTVPNSVKSLKWFTLSNCTSLKTVVIPDSVEEIPLRFIDECTSLTSLTIPFLGQNNNASTTFFLGHIFGATSWSNNKSYVPSTLKHLAITKTLAWSTEGLNGCDTIETLELPYSSGLNWLFGSSNISTNVPQASKVVPQSLKKVIIRGGTSVGGFEDCKYIEQVILPESATKISENAFYKCTSLKSIDIPSSVTSIGSYAFSNCTSLKSIDITNSVVSIGNGAFSNCTSLSSISLSNSLETIGTEVFSNCTLTSISIPASVSSLSYNTFSNCSSLVEINVSEENCYYSSQDGILYNKEKTTLIKCPESKRGEVIIPDTVTSISNRAFEECTSLTSITIPNSVTSIGNYAFRGCTSLSSMFIPGSISIISYDAFSGCTSLERVTIGEGVTSINNYAFYACTSLKEVNFPTSLISIGDTSFESCMLQTIVVPNSVTSISTSAFNKCPLEFVFYCGTSDEYYQKQNIVGAFTIEQVYFYSETQPVELGNYWHYADCVPTKW